jgi:small subunit ribosomal protein S7
MSRRHTAERREVLPDWKYTSKDVSRFINVLMYDGKRSTAEKVFYGAIEGAAEKAKVPPMDLFNKILENVKPSVEVRSRRVGGATYQVPVQVRSNRQNALAMRWIILAARSKKGRPMATRLQEELMDAFNNRGGAVKKREDTHKMAEANKAFSHFNW